MTFIENIGPIITGNTNAVQANTAIIKDVANKDNATHDLVVELKTCLEVERNLRGREK